MLRKLPYTIPMMMILLASRKKAPGPLQEERRITAIILSPHRKNTPSHCRRSRGPCPKALRPSENVARIEAALASPTEVCFVEAPLTEVLDYLKNHHQIEIQIDSKALEDAGVGTDVPVTIDLKGISLRSALNLMLRKLNLTWLIEDEVLLITIPEEAENTWRPRCTTWPTWWFAATSTT